MWVQAELRIITQVGTNHSHQVFAVRQVCEKYLANEKDLRILGVYEFGKGLRYYQSTWYVTDAKSVWSWKKIVESSAELLCRQQGVCPGEK